MDLMTLLDMLQGKAAGNVPLLSAGNPDPYGMSRPKFDFANSGFPTAAGSEPAPFDFASSPSPVAPPPPPPAPDLMGPHELMGPPKHLLGDGVTSFAGPENQLPGPPVTSELLEPVEVDHEKRSHLIDKPFYKDSDRMASLLAGLSNGFAGMTLRGKSGMEKMNNATFARAQQNIQNNKSYDYLLQKNPEMAQMMAGVPPEYRKQFMELYYKSAFADKIGTDKTADIRNWEYFSQLSDEEQKDWLGLKRGDRYITNPDGSSKVIYADGSERWITKPEDALQMTRTSEDAKKGGVAKGDEFRQLYKQSRYANDNIADMYRTKRLLEADPSRGGIFQPVEKFLGQIAAEFGDLEAASKVSNEELLKMDAVKRTMEWFLTSGLGARGLDTPAEFLQWLTLNGGDLSMQNASSIEFLDRAINREIRQANRYNDALTDPIYSDVDKIGDYQRVEIDDPRYPSVETQSQAQEGETKTVGGVTYVRRGKDWYRL